MHRPSMSKIPGYLGYPDAAVLNARSLQWMQLDSGPWSAVFVVFLRMKCCVMGALVKLAVTVTACRPGKPAGKLLRQPSSNRCSSGGVEGSGVQAHVKQVAASGMTQFRYQNHFKIF